MPVAKQEKEYTTIFLGSYEKIVKGQKYTQRVFSRVEVKVANQLGVKGSPGGERVIRKIKKGTAAGAQYASYQLGTRGKGYTLGFLQIGASSDIATKTRNSGYKGTKIPVPSGTPLSVVARFAQTLKVKPQKITTPKGVTFYLNNSKNSQGK